MPLEVALVSQKSGAAFDLTGLLDAWASVKASAADADADALFTKRLGAGISVIDPTGATTDGASSLVDIFPTAEESALLTPGVTYVCGLRLQLASGYLMSVLFYLRAERAVPLAAA